MLWPSINWYPLFQLFSVAISFWVLNISLMKISARSWEITIATSAAELIVIYHLTYTIVSYICVGAGCVFFISQILENDVNWKTLSKVTVIFSLLLLLGDCWRSAAMVTGLFVFCGPLLYTVCRKKRSICCFFVAICVIWGNGFFSDVLYHSQGSVWESYHEYNSLRTQVIDFPALDYELYADEYEEIGLSQNDYQCLYRWIFADREVFSENTLNDIVEMQPLTKRYNLNVKSILLSMFTLRYNYWFLGAFILALLFTEKKARWMSGLISLCTYAMIAALFVRQRPVLRVMIPMYLLGILALLTWSCYQSNKKGLTKRVKVGFLSTIMFIVICCLSSEHSAMQENYHNRQQQYKEVKSYVTDNPQFLFAASGAVLNRMEYSMDIFSVGEDMEVKNTIKLGSWDIYSQRYYEQMDKYQIEPQDRLLLALTQENVRYMMQDENELSLILKYLAEHTGTEPNYEVIKEFENTGVKILDFSPSV